MGAHFEALDEGVLLVPLDPRYTQVGFNLISVQVCIGDDLDSSRHRQYLVLVLIGHWVLVCGIEC